MFGFRRQRTRVVAGLLSRLEAHVVVLTRAALGELSGTRDDDAQAKITASGKRDLIPGAPLSNLGQLDLAQAPAEVLNALDGIVAKAEQVQGSKAGLATEAQQLIDDHYRDLAGIRHVIASGKSAVAAQGSGEIGGFVSALTEACNALDTTAQRAADLAR